jgi:hypothetical protein
MAENSENNEVNASSTNTPASKGCGCGGNKVQYNTVDIQNILPPSLIHNLDALNKIQNRMKKTQKTKVKFFN